LQDVFSRCQPRLLRHVADRNAVGRPCVSQKVLLDQGHDPQKGALAGAVAADHADLGPRKKSQPDVFQHLALAIDLGQVLNREDVLLRHVFIVLPAADELDVGRRRARRISQPLEV
jgi:hypothetical protein